MNRQTNNSKIMKLMLSRKMYYDCIKDLHAQQDKLDIMVIETKNKTYNLYSKDYYRENYVFHNLDNEKLIYGGILTLSKKLYNEMREDERQYGNLVWIV